MINNNTKKSNSLRHEQRMGLLLQLSKHFNIDPSLVTKVLLMTQYVLLNLSFQEL